MDNLAVDSLTEFRKVNVDGTMNLARKAVEAGVITMDEQLKKTVEAYLENEKTL